MITKEQLMDAILDRLDPDEVVDVFSITSEELVHRMHTELWDRRYRWSDVYDDDELFEEGESLGDYDEDIHVQRVIGEQFDD